MFERTMAAAALLALTAPVALAAQDWREVSSLRQRSNESQLEVQVRYGAGQLAVKPGGANELYQVGIRYDSDLFEPVTQYEDGLLEVGVEGTGQGIRLKNNDAGEMTLALSPDVPLDLDLDFGAVEADLELGGLRIVALDVETGASDTEIRFSEPNPIQCERLEISMGAAALHAVGLGNANCARIRFEGGVGDVTLDFSGEWRRPMEAELTIALGSATLVVPEDVGISVDKETFLADFDDAGFEKRGSVYYSRNWNSARHRLTVEIEGAFGDINIRRSAATGSDR